MHRRALALTSSRARPRRWPFPLLLVVATGAALLLVQALLLAAHPLLRGGVGQDLVDFYAGALALRRGLNPYAAAVSIGQHLTGIPPHIHPFAYDLPPFMPALFLPLTWLPIDVAYRVLCLVNEVCVAVAAALVYLAVRPYAPSQAPSRVWPRAGRDWLLVVFMALASGVGFLANWYGQVTPPLALAAAAALFLAARGHLTWAGGVAALTLIKPQLSLLALLVAFVCGGPRLRRGLALGALGLVALSLLTAGPGGCLSFIQSLVAGATSGGHERVHDPDSLALDGIYYQVFSRPLATALLVVTVVVVLGTGLLLLRIARDRASAPPLRYVALAALLLLDSLVLPYSHQYDRSVLLLPYLLAMFALPPGRPRLWILILCGLAALAPYVDLFPLSWGVRPLALIDLSAATLLCGWCLRSSQLELRPRLVAPRPSRLLRGWAPDIL